MGLYEGASLNPWHSVAGGDLPKEAENNNRIKYSIKVLLCLDDSSVTFGYYDYTYKRWYKGLFEVHPTHWMEIPEI